MGPRQTKQPGLQRHGGGAVPDATPERRQVAALAAAVFALTVATFAGSLRCGFVNFDDDLYVTESAAVRAGLSWQTVKAAFTTYHVGNWHPLTTLSLALDTTLGGIDPRIFHLHNVLLHALAAALLVVALARLSRRVWPAAGAAALFALHPLRVESVAWVSARKDVLSGVLLIAVLLAWEHYARAPSRRRMALVCLVFAAGLMAKPTLVVVPALLLILDLWPLGRLTGEVSGRRLLALAVEKWPLAVLSAAASAVTVAAQVDATSVAGLGALPVVARLANVPVAVVRYLGKLGWPACLAVHYPLLPVPAAAVLGASLVIAAITLAAARWRRRAPWLAAGWAWYLVGLVPVIGLVQVGTQAIADRYTYLPQIGLAVAIAWGAALLAERGRLWRQATTATAVAALLALAALSIRQVGVWRDSTALWRHAVACTTDNVKAHTSLGKTLIAAGQRREGAAQLRRALALDPTNPDAASDLAVQLYLAGDYGGALPLLATALARRPGDPVLLTNLGLVRAMRGEWAAAAESFSASLERRPDSPDSLIGLGAAELELARPAAAEKALRRALERQPGNALAWYHLGRALAAGGDCAGAAASWRRSLALDPKQSLAAHALAAQPATASGPGC